ncbi:hypothetical protein V8D89_012110 [Ganoderma adspersum]
MARTCRAFSGHTLDALWEVLDDIEPLLKVLPSYSPGQAHLQSFLGIKENYWKILLNYSSRVMELHFDGCTDNALHNPVLSFLLIRSGGVERLFPRLQTLRPSYLHPEKTAHVFPLLGYSGLQSLAVSFDAFKAIMGDGNAGLFDIILAGLGCGAPGLQKVILFGEGCEYLIVKDLHIEGLSRLPLLQRFVSRARLEPVAWMNLDILQRLKYLSITLDYRKDVTPIHSLALSELKTLTLKGSLANISAFLSQMEAPSLSSATFVIESSSSPPIPSEAVETFFCLLKGMLPHATSFAFTCSSICRDQSFHNSFHINLWSPLSFLTRLEELSIDLEDSFIMVSDMEISILSGTFPRLRSLTLRYPSGYSHPNTRAMPTIATLTKLATGCPELAYLHLAELRVDTSVQYTLLPALRHRLCVLEIDFFHLADCCSMSDFFLQLDRLFPMVTTIGLQDGLITILHKEINQILGIRKSIRQNDMDRGRVLN